MSSDQHDEENAKAAVDEKDVLEPPTLEEIQQELQGEPDQGQEHSDGDVENEDSLEASKSEGDNNETEKETEKTTKPDPPAAVAVDPPPAAAITSIQEDEHSSSSSV